MAISEDKLDVHALQTTAVQAGDNDSSTTDDDEPLGEKVKEKVAAKVNAGNANCSLRYMASHTCPHVVHNAPD